jgi:integrase
MARPLKQAPIEGRRMRMRLKRGRQAHWQTIIPNRCALGYQRWPEDREGRWIVRRYADGAYRVTPLALADDAREADGERIFSFDQAYAAARAIADAPTGVVHQLTVRAAMAAYIEHQRAHGHPVGDLISRTNAHILPALGDRLVDELTTERLNRWKVTLATSPAMKRSRRGAAQAFKAEPDSDEAMRRRRSSANRVLTMLKAALNRAFKDGKVTSDLAWRRVEPFHAVDAARIRYLNVGEAKRLVNAADPDFRPLVKAALQTGARYGELIRLEVADFNADAGTVAIRRSKTGAPRHVVLTDEGAAFFAQVAAGRSGRELMFRRADGGAWKASHQARPMADACARGKIDPPVGIHQLRHTWSSLAVMAGVPLMIIAKNLGHKDTRMIEKHYGHMAPSHVRDAIRAGAPKFGFVPDKKVVPLA